MLNPWLVHRFARTYCLLLGIAENYRDMGKNNVDPHGYLPGMAKIPLITQHPSREGVPSLERQQRCTLVALLSLHQSTIQQSWPHAVLIQVPSSSHQYHLGTILSKEGDPEKTKQAITYFLQGNTRGDCRGLKLAVFGYTCARLSVDLCIDEHLW